MNIDAGELSANFSRAPFPVTHELTQHPLLSVESIAQLAERLPEHRVEHNRGDLAKVVDKSEIERVEAPVGEIARGIETNGCWMVLKNIELDPAYKALLDETLDEVQRIVGDREGGMSQREGFIFLSAPGSMTPAHTDPEHNFLLQIRGTKAMNVGSFPDPATQQLVLEQTRAGGGRYISWEPKDPRTFDLQPGDGVYVHPAAPHYVQNGPTVSVSLSITFATPSSEQMHRVYSINARLRRLGLKPRPPGVSEGADRRKAACSRALGRVRRLASR